MSCTNNTNNCEEHHTGNRGFGFVIVVVLYILLAIIFSSFTRY